MEEKIIEAKFEKNALAIAIIALSILSILIGCYITCNDYLTGTQWWGEPNTEYYGSFSAYWEEHDNLGDNLHYLYIYGGGFGILCTLFAVWMMNACAMTVTDSRVIGIAAFRKRIDLPTSQITAVSLGGCGRVTVSTSSGRIHFWLLANRDEVHRALSDIISKVQPAHTAVSPVQSNADELRKYKELLDDGIITQAEFIAKKKQLLDL